MIVPTSRLLFWFALVVLPFTALGALHAEAYLISLVLIAALLAGAGVDAALAFGRLDGISVELSRVVRLCKDRPASFTLKVRNQGQKVRRVRLGLPLPPEIQSPTEDKTVVLPSGSEWAALEWECTAWRRGNFRLNRVCLEAASPAGFWLLRAPLPVECEMRVYPNLRTERTALTALSLHRGTFGLHAQRQVGKGREFEKLREYVPGDGYDEIHWKATAKRGHPVTKVFQIERTQEIYVMIDASRLSGRSVVSRFAFPVLTSTKQAPPAFGQLETGNSQLETSLLERYITSALLLGQAAEQNGDLFGLLAFTDKVETFVRARNGKAHYSACRDALYALQPQRVTPDFDEVAAFIRLRLRRRALIVFLTSLDDPVLAEGFVRNVGLLSRQHLVLVNMMKPAGANPLFSQDDVSSTDDLYRHLGGHLQWHNLRELEKILQRRGVRLSLLENETMAARLVSLYLGVKQRQLL